MAVPKRKTPRSQDPLAALGELQLDAPAALDLPELRRRRSCRTSCAPNCGWYRGRQAIEVD